MKIYAPAFTYIKNTAFRQNAITPVIKPHNNTCDTVSFGNKENADKMTEPLGVLLQNYVAAKQNYYDSRAKLIDGLNQDFSSTIDIFLERYEKPKHDIIKTTRLLQKLDDPENIITLEKKSINLPGLDPEKISKDKCFGICDDDGALEGLVYYSKKDNSIYVWNVAEERNIASYGQGRLKYYDEDGEVFMTCEKKYDTKLITYDTHTHLPLEERNFDKLWINKSIFYYPGIKDYVMAEANGRLFNIMFHNAPDNKHDSSYIRGKEKLIDNVLPWDGNGQSEVIKVASVGRVREKLYEMFIEYYD